MSPRLVRTDEVPPQPWRNGGGVTRELLAWPPGEAWQVRISVADITADGPFSAYPGVQRWFAVLEGAGVELGFDAAAQHMRPQDPPLHFDGAAAPSCRLLDGPTRDLNLMLRSAEGAMQAVSSGLEWHPGSARCGLFSAVAGRCQHDGQSVDLPARALLWFDSAPRCLSFTPAAPTSAAPGWWISASPQEPSR